LASSFYNVPSLNLVNIQLNVLWCAAAERKKEDPDFHFPATYFWWRSYQKDLLAYSSSLELINKKKENDKPKAKETKQSTSIKGAMDSPIRDASTSSRV
jgi:hypothetical protein